MMPGRAQSKVRLWPQQDTARRGNRALTAYPDRKGIKMCRADAPVALRIPLIRTGKWLDDIHRLAHIFAECVRRW